jgi:1-deoxy-D-xylulose-5-phosphate reductoisomerase
MAASVSDALAHPTWQMGAKITVDSATMMNKGLEIIEAHHLFDTPSEAIDVLVHPQSLVHSLVEYIDGTLIAQISVNDMRSPVLYALAWPDRLDTPLPTLDLANVGPLSFEPPDPDRFPALDLAREALRASGEMPAVLNAANEVAVAAFLDDRCPFGAITDTVASVMEQWQRRNRPLVDLDQAVAADRQARALASSLVGNVGVHGRGSL